MGSMLGVNCEVCRFKGIYVASGSCNKNRVLRVMEEGEGGDMSGAAKQLQLHVYAIMQAVCTTMFVA